MGEMEAPNLFGGMALFLGEPRSATIRGSVDTQVLQVSRADMKEVVQQAPNLLSAFADMIVSRKQSNIDATPEEEQEAKIGVMNVMTNLFGLKARSKEKRANSDTSSDL